MADLWNRPGIGNVGSYQASGHPWITGSTVPAGASEVKVAFPLVTKGMRVLSLTGNELRLHFASSGSGNVYSGNHYLTLPSGSATSPSVLEVPVKCREVFISAPGGSAGGSFQILAELTHIDKQEMYDLTGSGVTD